MLNLYKVSYDVKVGREWIGNGCTGGSAASSLNILERDALAAGNKALKLARNEWVLEDNAKLTGVRISEIELIASKIE